MAFIQPSASTWRSSKSAMRLLSGSFNAPAVMSALYRIYRRSGMHGPPGATRRGPCRPDCRIAELPMVARGRRTIGYRMVSIVSPYMDSDDP